jgi:multimeric flavodoxin WrbA
MNATILNCTLKPSPAESNTEALARVVIDALEAAGVSTELVRVADFDVKPGVTNDEGDGDQWPQVLERVLAAEILVIATPTWVGRPSSVTQRVLERMDALISETDDEGRPVAYNRVAGVVVTGNEDGAHHVISEVAGALVDIGYTIPRAGLDVLEQGSRPGRLLPRVRRGQGVVEDDRRDGCAEPRGGRAGAGRPPGARAAVVAEQNAPFFIC